MWFHDLHISCVTFINFVEPILHQIHLGGISCKERLFWNVFFSFILMMWAELRFLNMNQLGRFVLPVDSHDCELELLQLFHAVLVETPDFAATY